MFWNLWCEKVKFLQPEEPDSSRSETSVATSTTNSTLYIVSSKNRYKRNGARQLWCQYGGGDSYVNYHRNECENNVSKWTDKHLYIGKEFEEYASQYRGTCDVNDNVTLKEIIENKHCSKKDVADTIEANAQQTREISIGSWYKVNRFSDEVDDNCDSGLYLKAEDYIINPTSVCNFYEEFNSDDTNMQATTCDNFKFVEIFEKSVLMWEAFSATTDRGRSKHRRRYSFGPQSHFLHGLGPWNVSAGERYSVQRKRACSLVSIRRQPCESELRLSVSKRQLVASISCEDLYFKDQRMNINTNMIKSPPKRPVVFFWTPDYWYRPKSSKDAYTELQTHLNKIRKYRQVKRKGKRLFRRRNKAFENKQANRNSETDTDTVEIPKSSRIKRLGKFKRLKSKIFEKAQPVLCCLGIYSVYDVEKVPQETNLQYLKRILKLEMQISPWDFDSTTIAQQLTLIDRDLFLKIPAAELGVLMWQQSSKNAPNIGALIAFSHRISCLVATEILKQSTEKARARLVARFINAAEKCNKINNYQSCKSILSGLQSPAIYRLYSIWNYIRKKHATKYEIFQNLCKIYRDPRLPNYYRAFSRSSQYGSYMPYIGDIIERLLDRVPDYSNCLDYPLKYIEQKDKLGGNNKNAVKETSTMKTTVLFKRLLSTIKQKPDEEHQPLKKENLNVLQFKINQKDRILDDFYLPLYRYADNRTKCFEEGSKLLIKYQKAAALYIFSRNELAMEYLLKARYREDRENFNISFKIETACKKYAYARKLNKSNK